MSGFISILSSYAKSCMLYAVGCTYYLTNVKNIKNVNREQIIKTIKRENVKTKNEEKGNRSDH